MKTEISRIDHAGRIVIPVRLRKSLGLHPGDEILIVPEDGSLRTLSVQERIKHAQILTRRYIPKGRSLVDELIKECRETVLEE